MVDEIIEETTEVVEFVTSADYSELLNNINNKLDILIEWLNNFNDWLVNQQFAMNLVQGFIAFVLLIFVVWFAIKVIRLFI